MKNLYTKIFDSKFTILWLVPIIIMAFVVRTYKIHNPVADWHSWRQADTAAVSRNFVKDGFNPLFPQYDALNPLNETGQPNPNRYFFAEFPLYNIITYVFYSHFGVHEEYARLISIFFSVATILFLYLLVEHYSSRRVALVASIMFAFLPYNIYYGRTILPDPMYIFGSVLCLYLVSKWLVNNNIVFMILAGLAGTLAILEKPYALVLVIPILYLFYRRWGIKLFLKWTIYAFLIIVLVPFLWWRHHIYQHPEGMFGTTWLFNQGNIRFTGAYFRWLIYDRMSRLIFATGGFVLFWIGIVRGTQKKEGYFYLLWLAGILAFFVIIAKGNVTHDYYQMPIVPVGCVLMALGFDFLLTHGTGYVHRAINIAAAVSLILIMFAFGWYEVRGYYNINHPEIVEAGKEVDRILPKNAIVIAPYDNDSAFLYQTNRHGFSFGGDKIPLFIKEGATHLVSTNFDDTTNYWMNKCNVVEKTTAYVIIDLKNCKPDVTPPLTK